MCYCKEESSVEKYEYRGLTIKIERDSDPMNPRTDWENLGDMVCWHRRYKLGDDHEFSDADHMLADLFSEIQWGDKEARAICLAWVRADKEGFIDILRYKERDDREVFWRWVVEDKIIGDRMDWAPQEVKQLVADMVQDHYVILPIYLYDHSGITINTSGFSCRWDSGQVGFVYTSLKDAANNWGCDQNWDTEVYYDHDKTTKTLKQRTRDLLNSEVKVYDQYLTGQVYGYVIEDEDENLLGSCWGFFDDYDLKYVKQEAESEANYYADQADQDFQI